MLLHLSRRRTWTSDTASMQTAAPNFRAIAYSRILMALEHACLQGLTRRAPSLAAGSQDSAGLRNSLFSESARDWKQEDIRNFLVDLFKTEWPSTLTQWDTAQAPIRRAGRAAGYPLPGAAIRLATDCAVPDALPAAYYALCRAVDLRPHAKPLHTNELRCVVAGRAQLQADLAARVEQHMCVPPSGPCAASAQTSFDPLQWLQTAREECARDGRGQRCLRGLQGVDARLLAAARTEVWAQLPAAFSLSNVISGCAALLASSLQHTSESLGLPT
ncbi:hypothetical protein BV25DRAFT_1918312 [Artomyces pyxidatus]|uniref:Uncharacterized protein n=1 Tax=Artomyces pyxidatus TaxID=48021 RepID=A0ACB8SV98_9AGAM|nr:hypothetical protein BV25DRAFT_1918312 [Artomyces pyxidatus]